MKKIYLVLVLIFALSGYSQSSITITMTQDCNTVAGIYDYIGVLNGKNQYYQTFTFSGQTENIRLGYNSLNWVLYRENDITDVGFYNNIVPAGVLPPLTGWQNNPPNGCTNGTMTVAINNLANEKFEKSIFDIYPNPATNYLKINNNQEKLNYEVLDINGRIIIYGTALETIDISNLNSGMYFLKINSNIKKFIKT